LIIDDADYSLFSPYTFLHYFSCVKFLLLIISPLFLLRCLRLNIFRHAFFFFFLIFISFFDFDDASFLSRWSYDFAIFDAGDAEIFFHYFFFLHFDFFFSFISLRFSLFLLLAFDSSGFISFIFLILSWFLDDELSIFTPSFSSFDFGFRHFRSRWCANISFMPLMPLCFSFIFRRWLMIFQRRDVRILISYDAPFSSWLFSSLSLRRRHFFHFAFDYHCWLILRLFFFFISSRWWCHFFDFRQPDISHAIDFDFHIIFMILIT